MIRIAVTAAVLSAFAMATAAAADRLSRSPVFIHAPAPGESPYYVINQGPELSGPGIMIVEIPLTGTDMRRSYPFIGTSDDLTPVVMATTDFYGAAPATYGPPATVRRQIRSRSRHGARPTAWRPKPAKQRAKKPLKLHSGT